MSACRLEASLPWSPSTTSSSRCSRAAGAAVDPLHAAARDEFGSSNNIYIVPVHARRPPHALLAARRPSTFFRARPTAAHVRTSGLTASSIKGPRAELGAHDLPSRRLRRDGPARAVAAAWRSTSRMQDGRRARRRARRHSSRSSSTRRAAGSNGAEAAAGGAVRAATRAPRSAQPDHVTRRASSSRSARASSSTAPQRRGTRTGHRMRRALQPAVSVRPPKDDAARHARPRAEPAHTGRVERLHGQGISQEIVTS